MRKVIMSIVTMLFLVCCSKNDCNDKTSSVEGTWQLIEMSGSIPNSVSTGTAMDWQEQYLLLSDGAFTKTRTRNGKVTTASGSYEVTSSSSNEKIILFNYQLESDLIGSCGSNVQEAVVFDSNDTFFSAWQSCDGPGLKYKKVD